MKPFKSFLKSTLFLALCILSESTWSQSLFNVQVKGKGKPMILIHGLYCSGAVWKETVEHYQNKYECHILTVAGFGGTAPALKESFLSAVKDDLILYVNQKKLKKPILMGHSMGGFVSLWAASSAPGLFEKVISVDGLPFLPGLSMPGATPESSKVMAESIKKSMSNLSREQIATNQKQYLPIMISDSNRIKQVVQIAITADANTQAEVMYEMFTTDLRQSVSRIDCPVLVMGAWIAYKQYGAIHDTVLKAYQDQMAQAKNCSVVINDTSRHFIFYDDPTWFYDEADKFLMN